MEIALHGFGKPSGLLRLLAKFCSSDIQVSPASLHMAGNGHLPGVALTADWTFQLLPALTSLRPTTYGISKESVHTPHT